MPNEPVLRSRAIQAADRVVRTVASKDVTLTLIGESGVGKEVLARRAHDLSRRRAGPFIAINCAAIPEALFETELFGHERGAFTGATEQATGKIGAAEHGTLLLDEIGELSMPMQAKLLRFLEHRRYMRVGGSRKIEADVRLMFATLRPLDDEVAAGRFRSDLFYRIQGITVRVPPLRERKADILPLLDQCIAQMCARHEVRRPHFGREVRARIVEHTWPGNVRELRNLVEALCLLKEGRPVRVADLPERVRGGDPSDAPHGGAQGPHRITLDLDAGLENMIDQIIAAALEADLGNKAHAAARLGISVRTIQRRGAQRGVRRRQRA